MIDSKRKKLGEILVEKGAVTGEQLEKALERQRKSDEFLGQSLVRLGFIKEETLAEELSSHLRIPKVDLSNYLIDPEITHLVKEDICREYCLIPLFKIDNTLTIAMANPMNIGIIDRIQSDTGCIVEPVISAETGIKDAIDHYYRVADTIQDIVQGISAEKEPSLVGGQEIESTEKPPVVKAVDLIVSQAITDRASDIHIEPDENILRVRYRIDGILHENLQLPIHLHPVIVSRIKILSGMNIAEKRVPQDGHIEFKAEGKEVDMRVSTFPTIRGEKIVLRLLYRGSIRYGLTELGFPPNMLKKFESLISHPHGIILVTGPTGSGKTTTLYAALDKISAKEINITTIEDPVEYELSSLNQSQINPRAGWTFEAGLRNILRQDPDVIMVGEIRDMETARMAIQSALTGHLVFSTLHTNDASGTVTRLIDMGIEPFLVSSSIIGALAQRLVRLICPRCKETYEPGKEFLETLGLDADTKLYRGKGCHNCNNTGYRGRTGIFEFMIPGEELRSLIITKSPPHLIRQAARRGGMITLREAGLPLVKKGRTTVEELLRVTQDEEK